MKQVGSGSLAQATRLASRAMAGDPDGPVLIFDARHAMAPEPAQPCTDAKVPSRPRARGRPRLGVMAREVTLLPSHWRWLAAQPERARTQCFIAKMGRACHRSSRPGRRTSESMH